MSTVKTPEASINGVRSLALRLCIWAGIVGPILYALAFTLDGALRPGYSAIRDAVSFLLLGSRGWLEVANFIIFGFLLILFAFGFFQWMRPVIPSGWRRVSTALLVLSGVGFFIAALFLPDPVGELQVSIHAKLHAVAFTTVFFPLGLACIFIGSQFSKIAGWRIHGWYSMITGLIPVFASLGSFFSSFFLPPAPQPPLGGLFERILFVIVFAWYVILASHMLIRERG